MAITCEIDIKIHMYDGSDFASTYATTLTASSMEEGYVRKVEAAIGGTTLETSGYGWTDVAYLYIKNTDSSNYVTVTYKDAASAPNSHRIEAGKAILVSDVEIATDPVLTANTAAVVCEVMAIG